MEIVLFILGTAGLAWILVDSEIIRPLRDWLAHPTYPNWILSLWHFTFGRIIPWKFYTWINKWIIQTINKMIHCYGCCGFWCGLVVGYLCFDGYLILVCGFAGSWIAPIGYLLGNYLEAIAVINMETPSDIDI